MKKTRFLTTSFLLSLVTIFVGCSSEEILIPKIVGVVRNPTYKKTFPKNVESAPEQSEQNLRGRIIVVDAGHGGHDPGCGEAGYSRLPEKTLALAIAKDIEKQLKACGAKVIMTRTADYFVPLDERVAMADKYKADLLLSIHIDSCPNGYVNGPTVYIANEACYQSHKVANSIHSFFIAAGIGTKGIRHADFRVLVKHPRPAVLVECGYLTNSIDAQKLNSSWYQEYIAKLISKGVILSLGEE